MRRASSATAAGVVFALAVGVAGSAAVTPAVSIVFRGSYVLEADASQAPFRASTGNCVPGVVQLERERIEWTIRYRAARLPSAGTVSLPAQSAAVTGVHVWEETSAKCAAYPAGHLVCRGTFTPGRPRLTVTVARGIVTFHPELRPIAISRGCRGEVYNEHPDCGARDSAAVTDFAFATALRSRAPTLDLPESIASFDVSRSRRCAHPGLRNPNEIKQSAAARYAGVFTM